MGLINWIFDYLNTWKKYNYYVGTLTSKYLSYIFLNGDWWNKLDNNIFLGALPLHNSNHLEILKNENIGAVLSVIEDFELNGTIYFHPINKNDWRKNNINHLHIQIEDSFGLRIEDMKTCIQFINQNINDNRKIYIHCKAGRGRSASVVLCYFLWKKYIETGILMNEDIYQTYDKIKLIRNEISISENQFMNIKEFVQTLLNNEMK
jgi:atypical dual specificity phosphatase